jgi:NADH-quinone oxidoreductase subunit L
LYATVAGRVQTDIKTALCFASLTQVGLIVAEIGFGLPRYIPLVHILGHGCLRSLQFVRAPSLLLDYRTLENAIGARLTQSSSFWERLVPEHLRARLYRLALERGYLDAWLTDGVAAPLIHLFQRCDALERRWIAFLSGSQGGKAKHADPALTSLEDLV